MKTGFTLHIPPDLERRLRRLRAPVQRLIRVRLEEILQMAMTSPLPAPALVGPPLRFYAGDSRLFYRVEQAARRVVVLDLRPSFG